MIRFIFLFLACVGNFTFAQVETFRISDELYFNPTQNSMSYMMANLDTSAWNKVLKPMGFKPVPELNRIHALEYKKITKTNSQYISFDDRFGVLTIIWLDERRQHSMSSMLKKSLKGKDKALPGTY